MRMRKELSIKEVATAARKLGACEDGIEELDAYSYMPDFLAAWHETSCDGYMDWLIGVLADFRCIDAKYAGLSENRFGAVDILADHHSEWHRIRADYIRDNVPYDVVESGLRKVLEQW